MSIIRTVKTEERPYTRIDNESIRDSRISFKARGLHHFLVSHPDKWEINTKHLVSHSDRDGRDSIYSALAELEEFGYIVRRRIYNSLGRIEWETEVHEIPQANDGTIEKGKTTSGKSRHGSSSDSKRVSSTSGKSVSGKSALDLTTSGFPVSGETVSGKSGPLLTNEESTNDQETNDQDLKGEEVEPEEIRPPVNETEKTGEKDSTSKGGSKNRSSAAAPAVRPPSELERFKALYNERRPKAWGAMQQVTTVRKGKWKTLVAEMGGVEEALVALGNALDYCCSDPWWSTKNLTFDNMATNGKIVQLHEKQLSKASTAQAMPAAYHPPAPAFEYRQPSIEENMAAIARAKADAAAKAALGAQYATSN
jgi:hypothetical protein